MSVGQATISVDLPGEASAETSSAAPGICACLSLLVYLFLVPAFVSVSDFHLLSHVRAPQSSFLALFYFLILLGDTTGLGLALQVCNY